MANLAIRDEAEWLSVRSDYVGGSEISSLFYRYLLAAGFLQQRAVKEALCFGLGGEFAANKLRRFVFIFVRMV